MEKHTDLINQVLDLCKNNCDECDVILSTGKGTPVEFESNRIKNIHSKQYQSISLRIIKDGRLGIAATDILDDPKTLVANAIESAEYGSKVDFTLPTEANYPTVELYDKEIENVTIDDMLQCSQSLIDTISKLDPNIVCDGGISKGTSTCEFASSKGLHGEVESSGFAIGISGTIVNGTDMLFIGDGKESCKVDWDTSDIIKTVTEQYERTRQQAKVRTGMLPVIFSASGFTDAFIPSICDGVNGKLAFEGASPLSNKLGTKVFDEKFTLIDDATVPYISGSRPFDSEGIGSQRLELFKDGVAKNFLYDLKTAKMANTHSTGHGTRGGGLSSPTNLVFVPGSLTQEEMINDIEEGLLIEELMGAEQGNVLGGEFSGNVLLGYKIEKGKIVGRVKDTVVSGNIYELLKDIKAVGSDIKWNGTLYAPSFYFPAVSCASH